VARSDGGWFFFVLLSALCVLSDKRILNKYLNFVYLSIIKLKHMIKKITLAIIVTLFLTGESYAQTTYTYTGKPRFQIITKRNNVV